MTPTNNLASFNPYAANAEYKYAGGMQEYENDAPENFSRGFEPLETLPATWYNTLMNALTKQAQATKTLCDSIYAELSYVIEQTGQTLSASDTTQLKQAIDTLAYLNIASTTVLGGVKSNPIDWGVVVDSTDGTMTVQTVDASTTEKGIVQLYDGTDSTSTTLAPTANAVKGLADTVAGMPTFELVGTTLYITTA